MISIITPVYNGERFIESCIQVVISQNCPKVEHIIVDGGSTDQTVEIIQHYAQKHDHIRWISERDRGQSDAMNKGIALAKGEIIGILNVDDFYEPNVLNRVLSIFETLPEPSFLVGNCYNWDGQGNLLRVNQPSKLRLWDLVKEPFLNPFPSNPSAYFYHSSLHQKTGLYEVEEHYTMDLDFILRAVQAANVKYIDEFWGNFCQHDNTKTAKDQKNNTSEQRIIRLIKQYRKDLFWGQQILLEIRDRWQKILKTIGKRSSGLENALRQPQTLPKLIKAKLASDLKRLKSFKNGKLV